MYKSTLSDNGQIVSISAAHQTYQFHAIWLRDNAQDTQTRSVQNGQRLITLQNISTDLQISATQVVKANVSITFQPENKTIDYPINWLIENCYDQEQPCSRSWAAPKVITWDQTLANDIPTADYHTLQSNRSELKTWLHKVAQYGFAKVENGPVESLSLMSIVELFGYVRETNYGRHFEVRTKLNANNLAYTGMALQAHTDNPYRDPVPSLQILYCLQSSTDGGQSMVVDGFHIAEQLRKENQAWFDVLSRYCARFEYVGDDGVHLRARHPIIELSADKQLKAIHFNNRSTAALADVPFNQMELYYTAYRRIGELIDDSQNAVAFHLKPGESFIVDNTRVLHARTAFSGAGERWLQGCYADKDGLLSTLASL